MLQHSAWKSIGDKLNFNMTSRVVRKLLKDPSKVTGPNHLSSALTPARQQMHYTLRTYNKSTTHTRRVFGTYERPTLPRGPV